MIQDICLKDSVCCIKCCNYIGDIQGLVYCGPNSIGEERSRVNSFLRINEVPMVKQFKFSTLLKVVRPASWFDKASCAIITKIINWID